MSRYTPEERRAYQQSLPKKRSAGGALIKNNKGEMLIVKPTYADGWHIPGGTVDENESPRTCCIREVKEELGLDLAIGDLLMVDFTSDDGIRTDSYQFIFDGGTLTDEQITQINLPLDELSEFLFVSSDKVGEYLNNPLAARFKNYFENGAGKGVYMEDGRRV